MSKLTKKQRDALPASAFVDPAGRRFPIQDGNDVKDAAKLFGRATGVTPAKIAGWKARLKSMAAAKGLTKFLPASWKEAQHGATIEESGLLSDLSIVAFAGGDDKREEGDYVVYPQRKLFEDGTYPSHQFEMDPDELSLVPDMTERATLDLEHKPTVIRDDLIGHATNFTTDWQGEKLWLRGDVHIHKLLDPLLKPDAKLSTTWDRESRTLQKVALLLNPKIPDAALQASYAAFSAVALADKPAKPTHDTRSGQRTIQRLHDIAAEGGAECQKDNVKERPTMFASKHEASALQTIHDHTVQHGASCEGATGGMYGYFNESGSGEESGREAGMGATAEENKGKPDGSSPPKEPAAPPARPPAAAAGETAEFSAMRADMARMQQDLEAANAKTARLVAENRHKDAVAFADRFIRGEKKVKPGVRDTLVALAELAMEDDVQRAVEVTFSGDQKGGRLAGLAQLLSASSEMNLTQERIVAFGDGDLKTLGENDVDQDGMKSARQRVADRAKRYAGVKPDAAKPSPNGNTSGGK